MSIDTDRFSAALRERAIRVGRRDLRIARLEGSEQATDLTDPVNCGGFGRVRHFRRKTQVPWPENPLPIDPAAKALGLEPRDVLRAQVFQNAVCNWRCWYCYVDYPLLSGNDQNSEMLSVDQLLDLYEAEEDRASVIDLSGGQPDLVPEWVVWMIEELEHRGHSQKVYLWSDDNLSNSYFWEKLDNFQRKVLEEYKTYGKVCCFKGFDSRSFAFNTGAMPEMFDRQFDLMDKLVRETSLDLYSYATFTTPDATGIEVEMSRFVDRLQEISPTFPLRLVPLRVEVFTPSSGRIGPEHAAALAVQDEAITAWSAELQSRFSKQQLEASITEVEIRVS